MNCGRALSLRLDLAPVVIRPPVTHQLLKLCELSALRPVVDGLPVGPPRGGDAPAEIDELLSRNVDVEGPDCVASGCAQGRRNCGSGPRGREARKNIAPVR